jgi:trehalose 6-phosphate synthase/phosphatase
MAVDQVTPQEVETKFNSMLHYVNTHTIDKWAYKFLKDIKFVNQKRKTMLGLEGRQLLNNKLQMEKKKDFVMSREFIKTFKAAESRLIIILLEHSKDLMLETNSTDEDCEDEDIEEQEISDKLMRLLNKLSDDKKTKIWLISSDEKSKLLENFSSMKISLAAEDGYFYRDNTKADKNIDEWSRLIKDGDCSWIELVRTVMKVFTDSTEGSFIEEKDSMIAWNYSKVAPDYGQGQMKEMNSLLKDLFRNFDIEIVTGKGKLEVKSKAETKKLILKILGKLRDINPVDFIFAFGDKDRYEDIFSFLENKRNYYKF